MKQLEINSLLDLSHTLAADYLSTFTYPWEALGKISDFIKQLGYTLPHDEYDNPEEHIWIAKNAEITPSASLSAPCIVGKGAVIRHCAYLRGAVLVGESAVIGNSCEIKNSILFDSVQVPHFNYVGDSILGYRAHMGAGAVTSNVKGDRSHVTLALPHGRVSLGGRKVGAILGDSVEIGCGTVLNPGTVIGRHTQIYPLVSVRGFIPESHIVKSMSDIVARKN